MSDKVNLGRRQFLGKASAAIAGLSIAPGMLLFDFAQGRPLGEPASKIVRWGMLIDTTLCDSGCNECVSACSKENGWPEAKRGFQSGSPEEARESGTRRDFAGR